MRLLSELYLFLMGRLPQRPGLKYIIILLIAASLVFVLIEGAYIFRPDSLLISAPFIEDTFYALSVARNLGIGNGFTIDGTQLTNGVQPLVVVFYAPFYKITRGDRVLPLRFILAFSLLVTITTALLFGEIGSQLLKPGVRVNYSFVVRVICFFLTISSFSVFAQMYNGLETGLYLCLLTASALISILLIKRIDAATPVGALSYIAGVIYGLTILSRIDAGFYIVTLVLFVTYKCFKVPEAFNRKIRNIIALCALPILLSSTWWVYNFIYFGSIMPTSGQAEMLGGINLAANLLALFRTLAPNILLLPHLGVIIPEKYLFLKIIGFALALSMLALVVKASIIGRRSILKRLTANKHFYFFGLTLLIHISLLAGIYAAKFITPYFFDRYLSVTWVLLIPIYGIVGTGFILKKKNKVPVFLVSVMAVGAVTISLMYHCKCYFTGSGSAYEFYNDQVLLVYEHVPAGAKVGGKQTGTLGYFRDNVVNLDGKVNPEVLPHLKNGTVSEYLLNNNIFYLADWHSLIFNALDSPQSRQSYVKVAASGRFELWEFKAGRDK